MTYESMKLNGFLDELGSKNGVPGGGAAAALCAATGAGLLEMVLRINGQKGPMLRDVVSKRRRLQKLMWLDAQGFLKVSALYKSSRETEAYQKALQNAAKAPEEICRIVSQLCSTANTQKGRTSRWLISDLREAAILFDAAFESARLNVEANLQSLKDARYANVVRSRIRANYRIVRRVVPALRSGS